MWIALAASAALLIIIAAPLRLSARAAYRGGGDDLKIEVAAHYAHPALFRVEYSTEDENARLFIFGFGWKGRDRGMEDQARVPKESKEDDGADADSIYTAPGNDGEDAPPGGEKHSLLSRIKETIDAVKQSRAYRIISDRPLRRKLSRWLKRSLRCALRLASMEKFKLRAKIGLRNPATLGKAYGYFSAVKSALALQKSSFDLSMEPAFTERCFDVDSELTIKTTLSTIVWQLAVIAATCPYLRILKHLKSPPEL
jgi:hypothetical protein